MTVEFQSRRFEITRCSDNDPDSMYLEIAETTDGKPKVVFEIRYFEVDGTMSFSAFEKNLPFELVEHLASTARKSLTPVGQAAE